MGKIKDKVTENNSLKFKVGDRVRGEDNRLGEIVYVDYDQGTSLPYRVKWNKKGPLLWEPEWVLELITDDTITVGTSGPVTMKKAAVTFRRDEGIIEVGDSYQSRGEGVTDNVNHHTSYPGIEVIQLTEHLNFCRGNAVKYIARAGLKSKDTELEDLLKAQWYLTREIDRLTKDK